MRDVFTTITINTPSMNEGSYRLGWSVNAREGKGNAYYENGPYGYFTDDGNTLTGLVAISGYDRTHRTIKGTFHFRARCWHNNDTVSVTDGRFYLEVK